MYNKKLKKTMLLGEWAEFWYETYAKPYLKTSTLVSYNGYINNHIKPYIGNIRLCDINASILQQFFNDRYKHGNCREYGNFKGSGLSAKTLHNMRNMLHEMIDDALKNNLVVCNYVETIRLPKLTKNEHRILTPKEEARLIGHIMALDDQFAFAVLLCLSTGMRLGELCGLQWADFIHESESRIIIKVQRTVQRIRDLERGHGTYISVGTPKTHTGIREIPLSKAILPELEKHYKRQESNLGKLYVRGKNYVFSRIPGVPIEPKLMRKHYKRLLAESCISETTFHALRHTFATRAMETGVDCKVLSTIIGHANVATTMNMYQHVSMAEKRKAIEKVMDFDWEDDDE